MTVSGRTDKRRAMATASASTPLTPTRVSASRAGRGRDAIAPSTSVPSTSARTMQRV